MTLKNISISLLVVFLFVGCATQQKIVQTSSNVQSSDQFSETESQEKVLKRKVAIARFSNETKYANGAFYDKDNDPIGKQALDILSSRLTASEKFILLERNDLQLVENELALAGAENLSTVNADYLIIGSVTEYGRKNIGDVNVFSRSKTQIVEAGVSLRLIDVTSGQIIYSEEAKGEAETKSSTSFGLGERAGYDATLEDEAISAAISKLVENVINNLTEKPWRSYFLSYDDENIIISGGEHQGLEVGDTFSVYEKGKKVKNPQTGMFIELPGKKVGLIKVDYTGGETVQNEYALVSFTQGGIDRTALESYYVSEVTND